MKINELEQMHKHLELYLKALIDRVGVQEGDRIYRLARSSIIELKQRTNDGQYIVGKDDLEEVCRYALEANCFGCKKTNWHNCALYKIMKNMGIGSVNDTKGLCEFYFDEM